MFHVEQRVAEFRASPISSLLVARSLWDASPLERGGGFATGSWGAAGGTPSRETSGVRRGVDWGLGNAVPRDAGDWSRAGLRPTRIRAEW